MFADKRRKAETESVVRERVAEMAIARTIATMVAIQFACR